MLAWEANSQISGFTNHRIWWPANLFPAGRFPHLPSPTLSKPSSHVSIHTGSAQKSVAAQANSASISNSDTSRKRDKRQENCRSFLKLLLPSSSANSIVPWEGCPAPFRYICLLGLLQFSTTSLTPFLMYCLRKAFGFLMMLLCFSSFLLVTLFDRCVCDPEHMQGRTERRRVIMHNRCQLDSKQREDDFIFSYLLALSFAPNVLLRERKSCPNIYFNTVCDPDTRFLAIFVKPFLQK